MKKVLSAILALVLILSAIAAFASCGKKAAFTIAIPNDGTNEYRALKLLEVQGLIKLKDGVDGKATVKDIAENPYNIAFKEAEAALIPNLLQDVDYAVINSNYAIEAGLTPFVTEGTDVSYPNIISVKDGNQTKNKVKALVAAINSQAVADYINSTYKGAIVCDLKNVTADGFDASVDYDDLSGTTITVAASPVPHADILKVAKTILAQKGITLDIKEYSDYVLPNQVVESGEVDANYFQHVPYMTEFNEENGTHIVSVLEVHHEPLGAYSATNASFDVIKNSK